MKTMQKKRFSIQEAGFAPNKGLEILTKHFPNCPLCGQNEGYTHLGLWCFKCNACGITGLLNDIGPNHIFVFSVLPKDREAILSENQSQSRKTKNITEATWKTTNSSKNSDFPKIHAAPQKNSCTCNCTSCNVRWLLNGLKSEDKEITEDTVSEYTEEYERNEERE